MPSSSSRPLAGEAPDTTFTVVCAREAARVLGERQWPPNVRLVTVPLPAAIKPLRVLVEWTLLPLLALAKRFDVLHSLGTTSPPAGGRARLVTIHDLIHEAFPGELPAGGAPRAEVPRADRRAASTSGHRRLAGHAPRRRPRPQGPRRAREVVYAGLGMRTEAAPTPEAELRERHGLGDRPVVLCVSALLPHKNLPRLLDAFAGVADGRSPRPVLVIPGHRGRIGDELLAHAARLGIEEDVRFLGWIASADLEGLYRLATAFVYPSQYEGFGLPPLEAMRRDVPVACSNATSLPEIAGDAALLFDPTDVRAIEAAIERLLDDPELRRDLVARGRKQVTRFSWRGCARGTLAAYRGEALDGRGASSEGPVADARAARRPAGGTGGQTRQFHLMRRLVERGDDLEVVAPVHPIDREATDELPEPRDRPARRAPSRRRPCGRGAARDPAAARAPSRG